MKTTYEVGSYVRRFSTKATLGALFLTSVAAVTGCSDGSSVDAIPRVSCELASTSFFSSSVQVGVKTNAGASPDVSIRGAGFPPGAKVSVGYFGLPGPKVNDPTVDLDFADVVPVSDDGTFTITQHAVYAPQTCDADQVGSTISIAVGANGVLGGTTVPEAFWCENASTESYASACQ